MKDKDIKLEEIEVFHTLGGAGEDREGHILIMIYPKCSRRLSGRQWGQTYPRISDGNSGSLY